MLGWGRRLFQEGGVMRLYKGFIPRCARIIGAVFILSEARRRLTHLLYGPKMHV